MQLLRNFAVTDLSNFYLDVAKDRLYVRGPDDADRRCAPAYAGQLRCPELYKSAGPWCSISGPCTQWPDSQQADLSWDGAMWVNKHTVCVWSAGMGACWPTAWPEQSTRFRRIHGTFCTMRPLTDPGIGLQALQTRTNGIQTPGHARPGIRHSRGLPAVELAWQPRPAMKLASPSKEVIHSTCPSSHSFPRLGMKPGT